MNKNIDEIRRFVKNKAENNDWKYHIVPVVNYSKKLAKTIGVNEEIAELAALLHDIGRMVSEDENHHLTGLPVAEKILKKYNYSRKVIDEVKHCIESHRGSKDIKPRTKTAQIISNADVMAHFDNFPVLIFFGSKKEFKFEEIIKWLDNKIERDWRKKLTIPEAKEMMKEKYKAIRLILNSTKKYL